MADALELFWMLRGHVRENWPLLADLVAHVADRSRLRAAILVVAGNLLADVMYAALDPRIRLA